MRGRVNQVSVSQSQHTVRTFYYKANMASLRAQIAGAFLGDLGITALHPQKLHLGKNRRQQAPAAARELDEPAGRGDFYLVNWNRQRRVCCRRPSCAGQALFARAGCAVPSASLRTAAQAATAPGRAMALYTDLLLHDMGPGLLADGRFCRQRPRMAHCATVGRRSQKSSARAKAICTTAAPARWDAVPHDGENAIRCVEGFSAADRAARVANR